MYKPLRMTIRGTGHALPQRVVTNQELAQTLDTSNEWIVSRSGIRERRIISGQECTTSMAVEASRKAMEAAGVTKDEIDMIICGTITPDQRLPATACLIQRDLDMHLAPAFDITVACCGFLYAMFIAAHFVDTGTYNNVLVVATDAMTSMADPEDRATYVLFGDGAGAAVISRQQEPDQELIYSSLYADGQGAKLIWVPGGGTAMPFSQTVLDERLHYVKMKGREVYRFAVTEMQNAIAEGFEKTNLSVDDVAMVIPHQSNLRIIESAREKLGIPTEKMYVNIDRIGNTSAASVPICLDELIRDGRLKRGDVVVCVAFGAGLTWATSVFRL
jgi:3-oxoacyl-[acyl-carrier-protein] synthase-3